jgi:nucleoside-diphosphate-sugar epimerase
LVAGATGKTGSSLVQQTLAHGYDVRVIVRCRTRLPAAVLEHPNLTILEASILKLSDSQLADLGSWVILPSFAASPPIALGPLTLGFS